MYIQDAPTATEKVNTVLESVLNVSSNGLNDIARHIDSLEKILDKLRGSIPRAKDDAKDEKENYRPDCLMTELEKMQQGIHILESRLFTAVNELSSFI